MVCVRATEGANSDGGADVGVQNEGGCSSRDVDSDDDDDDDDDDTTGSRVLVTLAPAAVT